MKVYYGTSNPELSKFIIEKMNQMDEEKFKGIKPESLSLERFSDGEILPRFMESIREEDIFFIQTTNSSAYRDWETDRKSTRLNSSHSAKSRMPSSA